MADSKITALTSISTSSDPANDPLVIVDVSDTSMAATGTTKKVTLNQLLSCSPTATGAFTITGNLTVDTNTLVANASTDTVGIGTTSTDAKFRILDASGNGVRIGFLPGTFNYNLYDATVHEFRAPAGTNSFGAITANGIGLGLTPSASGIGVTFPAVQSASSDANCLDDYEEGAWTGTLTGSTTNPTVPVTQVGRYTKVGRQVTVQIYISNVVTTGASGRIGISGLPFANNGSTETIGAVGFYDIATFTGSPFAQIGFNATQVDLYSNISNSVYGTVTHNAGNARYLWFNMTYTV